MKTLTDQLAQYAAYHRDRRNIALHFIGIPMIVIALATLLARPGIDVLGVTLSPAALISAALVLFYFALDLRFGLAMALLLGLSVWAGHWFAAQPTQLWLSSGIGLFVVG